MFGKKKESRFKFAHSVVHHSVDPLGANGKGMMLDDEEIIEVPKRVQDLIVHSFRTISNSLSVKNSGNHERKSTAIQESQEDFAAGI